MYKVAGRTKIILFTLLILLNVILRYPTTPHQIGWDTYYMQILVNSLTNYGYAKWWLNPYSVFGLYPFSESSSLPFFLSGIAQITDLNSDNTTLLYSLVMGIASIFFAYILAKAIWNDDIFKMLVSIVYSLSPGILIFTTWTGTTRTLFISMLPILIYFLVKVHHGKKFIIALIVLFIFSFATHQMTYFVLPLIMSYIVVNLGYKFHSKITLSQSTLNTILTIAIVLACVLPFFNRSFMEIMPREYSGSRYSFLSVTLISSYVRYMGPLSVLAIGSIIYLFPKREKKFEEWFLVISAILLAPLLYIPTYMKDFSIFFFMLLIGIGISNIIKTYLTRDKKFVINFVVLILILSTCFSSYFQFVHPSISSKSSYASANYYMKEDSYQASMWVKNYLTKPILTDNWIAGISGAQAILSGTGPATISTGINIGEQSISKNPLFSINFFKYGPFVKTSNTGSCDYYASKVTEIPYDRIETREAISIYNISYVVSNDYYFNTLTSTLASSWEPEIYDNGKNVIWVVG